MGPAGDHPRLRDARGRILPSHCAVLSATERGLSFQVLTFRRDSHGDGRRSEFGSNHVPHEVFQGSRWGKLSLRFKRWVEV